MRCAECSACFKQAQAKQLFCSRPCKTRYHNRLAARGKVLAPLLLASRSARQSDTSKRAYVEVHRLVAQYNAEDKAAPRLGAWELVDHGYRHGTRER